MQAQLSAYIPMPATEIDVDGSTVDLPAGTYLHTGIPCYQVQSAVTSATITLGAHTLPAGESVEFWDISGNVSLGTRTIESVTSTQIVLDSSISVGINDRVFIVGDLLASIEARIAGETGYGTTVRPDSTDAGLAVVTDEDDTPTIDWGAYLADVLRIDQVIDLSLGAVTGERWVMGYFRPERVIVEDLPRARRVGSQWVATAGTFRKLVEARQIRHRLEVRYRGAPRDDAWNELHAVDDMLDLLDRGYRLRYYPDIDVATGPYARKTNPWGWSEWHVEGGAEFEPRSPVGGTYDYWTHGLDLIAA